MSTHRITEIEAALQDLDRKRHALLLELDTLRREKIEAPLLPFDEPVPKTVPEKIAFFLALFGARRSVYPKLWENPKTGRKGYSPVCPERMAERNLRETGNQMLRVSLPSLCHIG